MIVSDSSPLILLAKINNLELLRKLYEKVNIPEEVFKEVVVRGKQEKYADARIVENAVEDFIFVIKLKKKFKMEAEKLKKIYGTGESEAIALCQQESARLVLADNVETRMLAEELKVKWRSTPGILLHALQAKIIDNEAYENALMELTKHAWLEGSVVAAFMRAGHEIGG